MTNEKPRWFFIVNPVSGNGKGKARWPAYEHHLRSAGLDFDWHYSEAPGHAIELAREATTAGYEGLVAVGGDGTGNEVVNGIFKAKPFATAEELPLFTVLPIGTGNDWRRQHHIPSDIRAWTRFFQQGRSSVQDVGLVEWKEGSAWKQRYFINVMGMGYDGYVAARAARAGGKVASKLSYLLLVFRCLFSYRTPRLAVTWDRGKSEGPTYAVVVGINRFSGGGFQLVPQAIPHDGLLALTIARQLSRWEVMFLSPLFFTGWIGWHPAISLQSCTWVSAEPMEATNVLLEADGELLGTLPARVSVRPRALPLWVPAHQRFC